MSHPQRREIVIFERRQPLWTIFDDTKLGMDLYCLNIYPKSILPAEEYHKSIIVTREGNETSFIAFGEKVRNVTVLFKGIGLARNIQEPEVVLYPHGITCASIHGKHQVYQPRELGDTREIIHNKAHDMYMNFHGPGCAIMHITCEGPWRMIIYSLKNNPQARLIHV